MGISIFNLCRDLIIEIKIKNLLNFNPWILLKFEGNQDFSEKSTDEHHETFPSIEEFQTSHFTHENDERLNDFIKPLSKYNTDLLITWNWDIF